MRLEEKTIKKNTVYSGKIINLRRDDVLLPNGNTAVRELVEHPGGACILAVKDGLVYFVEQFRYPYGETLLELPAGKLEYGENPEHAALRELTEEVGLKAERAELVTTVYPTPGYNNEKLYLFRAEGLSEAPVHPDDDEFLNIIKLPVSEALAMIKSGKLRDAKSIILLLMCLKD
ncbi:MAG: NUDIX hydrolase [Clostridiaceae bacterium]|jgi:ADP-ribose pyrophosphatase|nr:NUDIX hydrolase [Clostridiaceae bacterium]